MATLYSYTSVTNNTWLNWNGANDNYAWSFTPTVSGTPTDIVLHLHSIVWTPIGNFYIKANKTIASSTYWTATWVTLTSWSNTITLTWWVSLTSWVQYWVYFERTSAVTDYPRIYNEYTSPPTEQLWRSTTNNIDPNTRYDSGVKNIGISMDVLGTTWATANSNFFMFF